ncbi:MAG: HEAT repeat domain-containing protein, partial [Candidatus Brocadiae bacterium]|nr:HEAT repeat domain-containing protein [Candidatus Brocadiia bacterium]
MARRRGLSQQERAAYARQAVDRVARADDAEAEARRVLDEAPDDGVRQAIVETSAGAPDNVTGALVNAALESGSVLLAEAAADFVVDLARSPGGLELLRRSFASDDASVRRRAAEALESFADPAAVLLLAKGLTDESPAVRRTTTGTLGFIVGTGLHPLRGTILEALSQPQSELARVIVTNADDQVRRQAVQALSFVKSALALPAVEKLCEDEDEEVRQEAVLCLAAIGSDRAVELMAKRLSDPSYRVVSSVLNMLAAIFGGQSPRLLEYLREAMSCPLPEVRQQAVLMLDRFNVDQVGSVLEQAVTDSDFEVARRASEMLRKLRVEGGLGWIAEEISQQTAGDKALSLWEAGNIGLQVGGRAGAVGAGLTELDEVVAALETSLREGSSSDKVHALNELAGLVDIADSDAMRDALEDKDASVRSRAADALSYTRDAALLARVLQTHPDAMSRRRAIEVMTGNPGGPGWRGAMGREIAFTSTRTIGMELFSYFLAALDDSDTEVRQHACAAIRDCAQAVRLLPVRQTVRRLERLASDEEVSVLMQEEAEYALEAVREGTIAEVVAGQVDDVLAWRGELAREAHAIRWDDAANAYMVDRAVGGDAAGRWAAAYKLSEQQLEAAGRAVSDAGALEQE